MKALVVTAVLLIGALKVSAQTEFEEIYHYTFGPFMDIHFFNDNLGVVVEDHYLRMTADGGKTWRSKFMLDMNASACGVSVMGNDTLFVIAEGADYRVSYFHGFNATPAEIYSIDGFNKDNEPTICFVGNNVYVAGGFRDTVTMEPGFLVSRDHGNTWQLQTLALPSGGENSIAGIHHRNADTTIVSWTSGSPSAAAYYHHYFWTGHMAYPVPFTGTNPFSGKFMNSMGSTSLTTDDYMVNIQRGSDISNWQTISTDFFDVLWSRGIVWLIESDEFLSVYPTSPLTRPDTEVTAYQFDFSTNQYTDTSTYGLADTLQVAEGRTAISNTENYVYILRPPGIYKVSRHILSSEVSLVVPTNKVTIYYQKDFQKIMVDGLEYHENYDVKIYSIGGSLLESPNSSLTSTSNTVDLSNLKAGTYIVAIAEQSTGSTVTIKVAKPL